MSSKKILVNDIYYMKKEIGKRLRIVRESKGISQVELGNHLGIQFQHVSKYERGESVPTWENLIKLIELLGVNINWLLTGKGKMFLTPLGYEEVEDKTMPQKIQDEETEIAEIIEELKKDKELKKAIYNYIKSIGDVRQATSALKRKADSLLTNLK